MTTAPRAGSESAPGQNGNATPNNKAEVDKLPLLEDAMQLARLGDIPLMKNLFESEKVTPDHKDDEGITPLHVSSEEEIRCQKANNCPVGCNQ